MDVSKIFWDASLEEMKKGYIEQEACYICLLCGMKVEKGIVYREKDTFYEAERYMRLHIAESHQSVFEYLIGLDKKFTGLTDHQSTLLKLFYQGQSDAEVQRAMDIGSASTIRNHRFVLKEKERQAKVFLAMMELLKEKDKHAPCFIPPHATARMVDDRYNVTAEEKEKLLRKYFPQGPEGPLKSFSMQEKHKLVVLREIVKRFQSDRIYSEREVNEILAAVYADHVTVRRYLIEYGFLDRKNDGSQYWLKE